jgi:Tfp pilus assembly protein PilP
MKPAEPLFERETYRYSKDGRRDPFVSLMAPGELRPMISDLELVAVAWDRSGRNSVAVLHDISTKDREQYRVRVGQSLGRMRVASITPKSVVFTIEEFGYSRQATLAIEDSNKERMK